MQVNGEAQNVTPHHAETPHAGVIKIGRVDYVSPGALDHFFTKKEKNVIKLIFLQ